MKIILVCFLHLDELPPLITILKVLSLKYNVLYIGVDNFNESYKTLFGNKVSFINVFKHSLPKDDGLIGKIKRFCHRRFYKYRMRKVNNIVEKYYQTGDFLWIQHEYTLMLMNKLNIPYYLTLYELPPDLFVKESELKNRINIAKKVIVPEYARASIVQACVGLKSLPTVIENKPFDFSEKNTLLEKNPMHEIAIKAHKDGKMVILYSGIFLRERKLDTFIEAVSRMNDKFILVLIGRESEYLEELKKKYNHTIYLGFFEPPKHLSVIRDADIGILTYVADSGSINPVFCAPNKIWEYSKYGIPVIGNDIPGLKYTVEYNKFGYCCDVNSIDNIMYNLNKIYKNYEELSKNAYNYYNSIDIKNKILNLIIDE